MILNNLTYSREIIQKIYAHRQRNYLYFLKKGIQNDYASLVLRSNIGNNIINRNCVAIVIV